MTRKMLLIDGNSLLSRAFYTPGYEELSYNEMPTGAIFGFFKMLSNILSTLEPLYLLVAFDVKRQTFRNDIYPEYKANRPDTPEKLIPQKKYARKILDAFNICWIEASGYEADDLIATVATKTHHYHGVDRIFILTGDKDLLQLINEKTVVVYTTKGVSETRHYTHENVKDLYGCEPLQVPDFKALVGDAADNIPGAPGIGKKKAAALLEEYHNLENIIQAARDGKIKGKSKETIESMPDQLEIYKKVATVCLTAPISRGFLETDLFNMTKANGLEMLQKYGIKSIKF